MTMNKKHLLALVPEKLNMNLPPDWSTKRDMIFRAGQEAGHNDCRQEVLRRIEERGDAEMIKRHYKSIQASEIKLFDVIAVKDDSIWLGEVIVKVEHVLVQHQGEFFPCANIETSNGGRYQLLHTDYFLISQSHGTFALRLW